MLEVYQTEHLNNKTTNSYLLYSCNYVFLRRHEGRYNASPSTKHKHNHSHRMQVTSDPAAKHDPKNENPGTVPKDSLAGESIQGGGSFAANSDARGVSGSSAGSTTANTTDTSNATRLDPAPASSLREADVGQDVPSGGRGPTYVSGAGGIGAGESVRESTSSTSTNTTAGAPQPSSSAGQGTSAKPHGKNITEGGFDSDAPNASFNQDVGGKNDPGRAALRGMQEADVPSAGGAGPREEGLRTGKGGFEDLNETSA